MTEEHKQKLKEAREKARLEKQVDKSDRVELLEKKLDNLSSDLSSLASSVLMLVKEKQKVEEKPVVTAKAPMKSELPIPSAWRQQVDSILGTAFRASVDESSGGDFLIKIYIPEQFDRRIGDDKTKEPDLSVGVVHRNSDVNDVRIWCEKIKSTLSKFNNLLPFNL